MIHEIQPHIYDNSFHQYTPGMRDIALYYEGGEMLRQSIFSCHALVNWEKQRQSRQNISFLLMISGATCCGNAQP